jgi:hypothetical protein
MMPSAVLDWDYVVNVVLDSGLLREHFGGFSHFLLDQNIVFCVKQIPF